jgi:hypothetical protein
MSAPAQLGKETEELLDALSSMVEQWCISQDGRLDSCAISAAAKAMRLLSAYGRMDIELDVGRRVVGRWSDPQKQAEAKAIYDARIPPTPARLKDGRGPV